MIMLDEEGTRAWDERSGERIIAIPVEMTVEDENYPLPTDEEI